MVGLSVSFLIQAMIVGSTGMRSGSGGDKTYGPWPGMGLFWWAGLIGPSAICILILFVYWQFNLRPSSRLTVRLAVSGLLLSVMSYLYGGIADRYFVSPMVLSWIASILLICDLSRKLNRTFRVMMTLVAAIIFAIPVFYWFDAMWFLTAGPKWSDEVSTAILECRGGSEFATLYVGESATELPCSYVLDN